MLWVQFMGQGVLWVRGVVDEGVRSKGAVGAVYGDEECCG